MAALLGWHLALIALLLVTLPGCTDCDSDLVDPSYRVVVVNTATGERVCDAQVFVVSESSRSAQMTPFNCTYGASIPNGQEATIEVSRDGFAPASKTVSTSFETDECDKPIEKKVSVGITPL